MSRFDSVRDRLDDGRQPCPYDDHMGFRFQTVLAEPGKTVILADVDDRFHNPNGVLHGGFLCGLADSAMGSCMFTVLGDDETCVNVDLSVKFLRPTTAGTLRAEGTLLKEGRTTCVAQAHITDEDGRLVARAESTFLRVPDP